MKRTIFYATGNAGKFDEVKRYLESHEPTIEVKQFDKDLPETQTLDQKAIALDKGQAGMGSISSNRCSSTTPESILIITIIFLEH